MQSTCLYFITLSLFIFTSIRYVLFFISNVSLKNAEDISNNDDIQSVHPSQSKNVGKEVFIQPVDLCQCSYEEVFVRIDYLRSPKFPLRDASDHHCQELLESMRNQGYDYNYGLQVMIFFAYCQPKDTMADLLLPTEDGQTFVKDGFTLAILDSWQRHATVNIMYKTCKHP